MDENSREETTAKQVKPATVPDELAATFDPLRKRYAPFAGSAALIDRGSRVATLDMTAATRNIIAEVGRYPEMTAVLARLGVSDSECSRISEATTLLEVAYHKSEGTTVDVSAVAANVDELSTRAKIHRAELGTIAENALPPVLAESVRRASAPTGGRPIDLAKALSGMVAALRGVPATWDGPDGKVDIRGRLGAFGLGEETLPRASETAEALEKAAAGRDRARVETRGLASGSWDIYDGILWEAGKAVARVAKTAAQLVGRADLNFSMGDAVRRIARVRKLKAKGAPSETNPPAPTTPAAPTTTPGPR